MSTTAKSITRLCLVVMVVACAAHAYAATTIDGRPNNPYGVMLGMTGSDHSDYASLHFQWARDLIGEWGHVRVSSGVHELDIEGAARTLAICRAKRIIPVMTGLYVPEQYRIPGGQDAAPYVRDDGYPAAAERYRTWAEGLARLGAVVPYYEVGNEINGKWKPEAYGKFIIAVSRALKEAMPLVNVTSAGLAGNGADFLTEVLTAVPEAKNHIDCWGLHPYAANHPPAYERDGYCLKGHLWTAKALAKFGIDNPKFVMTESGYEIGNKRDHRYPRITDELRARYLVEAYETIWAPDPRVVTLTVFMLQAANYPGWNGWVLVDTDCRKTETYKALAAVPKPPGTDWMPEGECSVAGRITDADSGQGLERVFVYTVPGIYAAETDSEGRYAIERVPAGSYEVRMFRDGFVSPSPARVTASSAAAAVLDASMKRVGLITDGMDSGDTVAAGWLASDARADDRFKVDTTVKRSGAASQRMIADPDAPPGIWQCTGYTTALPDRAFAAEVWVKGQGVRRGSREGPALQLAVTDSGAQPLSVARVNLPLEGDFDWTPVSVTVAPYPPGRRLTLTCSFDAEEGTVWFDDPYCHYADYPVPSRLQMPAGAGAIRGDVTAEGGEFIMDAVVCARPGNFWTITRSDGTYTLPDMPAGTYDLWAFKRGKVGFARYGVKVAEGQAAELNLRIVNPPAPREVQNAGFEHRGPNNDYTPGWMKYGEFDGIPENGWHAGIPDHPNGINSRTGNSFAGSIAGSNVKNGGLYQIIEVDPDTCYEVGVWSYTYQTDEGQRGDVANRLGVDPTGGDDPNGPYVIWTPYTPSHLEWTQLSLRVAPVTDRMTIFLDAKQVHGLMFNVNCFDDVTVEECAEALPASQMVRESRPAGEGSGPRPTARRDAFRPPFLWGFTAPGADPSNAEGADDIGPPLAMRERWIRQSGVTYWSVEARWQDAEPTRLPDSATEDDFDWTEFDKELDRIPPRMAAMCHLRLDAKWAEGLEETDEDEYWRLAERFMEFASRRAHSRGVRYYRTPGNEMSLTMRPDWAELQMKPVRHYAMAIHRGHPDNQVIAGALVVGNRDHINALYDHGFKEHVDILDIHAYAGSPGEHRYHVGLSQIVESHQVLAEHGDGHKRIFLGEGWSVFPLPQHIDHLKQPPTYTEEDFKHYRKSVVYGYAALTTPREGYDPNWLMGASFFCLNDLWGSMGWKKRATIEYDEHGDPAFWLLDGYRFPYEPDMMEPNFRAWGLIDIEGNPKGDIIEHFPPYIPRASVETGFVEAVPTRAGSLPSIYPGTPYRVRIGVTSREPKPLTNPRFSMDVFKGARDQVEFREVGEAPSGTIAQGETMTREFDLIANPSQVGRDIWVQGGCEYDWEGGSYYADGWLRASVISPGEFKLQNSHALAEYTGRPVTFVFSLKDVTGAKPPARLTIQTDDALSVTQTTTDTPDGAREYRVVVAKKDPSSGGAYTLTASAGPMFPELQAYAAFPRPGRTPEPYPARGRLINPGFEEYGPGSGFEGWDGPPSNWSDPEIMSDLPDSGERCIMRAYHGTNYAAENSQVVLVPEGFKAGDAVTTSAWVKGLAQVEATNHDAVRFRISVEFLDGVGGRVLRRDESPLKRGTGRWKKLEFVTGGAPKGAAAVRLVLMHENTDPHSWHKAAIDNAGLEFGGAR